MRTSRTAFAALALTAGIASLPLLAVASGPSPACQAGPVGDAVGVSILGPSTLTVSDLRAWWEDTGRGQPPRLGAEIGEVIAIYVAEGDIEGVRGDVAFAQAVLETGYFTNSDTARNNFAGIAHYDHADSARAFASVTTGVRAQIQLLHRYVAGNDVTLARPAVAPRAGASASTWTELAGTWASDANYSTAIADLYRSMLEHAAAIAPDGIVVPEPSCTPGQAGGVFDGYALPVDRHWYDEHPSWFTKPHHDYPAADIPVPTGTPIYSVTGGSVTGTPTTGRCGIGVVIDGDDGARYTYCHGLPGSTTVAVGDRVEAGQQVMLSASTGNSSGPHLHLGIRVNGEDRCPQPMLVAIAEGLGPAPLTLPSSGCTY
jgi:murein DD-endopeptidase MepM/ murein hydrolase activator NlpD